MGLKTSSGQALELVKGLQSQFVAGLEKCAADEASPMNFEFAEWLRDEGRHGGGARFFTEGGSVFNRASVNVSHIHYCDDPKKSLKSATAISTIIHPENPHAPSVHIHISWTEMKKSGGYWRVMADLNPAIPKAEDTRIFEAAFKELTPELYQGALEQGERYFYIPALERHRGVTHFYLEQYHGDNAEQDLAMVTRFGEGITERYLDILRARMNTGASELDRQAQLAYHTLYLFQVLTLDRGTTSGLLVHGQNDLGIMGSLPSIVNKALLASWGEKIQESQRDLLRGIVDTIPESGKITNPVRLKLAQTVRSFYQQNPEALRYQASGDIVPPTVANHQ